MFGNCSAIIFKVNLRLNTYIMLALELVYYNIILLYTFVYKRQMNTLLLPLGIFFADFNKLFFIHEQYFLEHNILTKYFDFLIST